MNAQLKTMREVALLDEIKSNSLQMEQLSEDVRGLTYAIRDLMEVVQSVGLEVVDDDDDRVMN
mgnify:FL=1|jgi:division protein CdvB (Snf7/Vps24/ESCRT-III family)